MDRVQELEEKLREDRIKIYNDILEPFIILLTKAEGLPNTKEYRGKTNIEAGSEKALSFEYKQTAFKLSLIGSDDVLRSFNNLMQYFYNEDTKKNSKEFMVLFGTLLLEIRKSVGNQNTDLEPLEMLEFLITDIRKYQ